MNGKGLSVKLSETFGFGSFKRVEQMSQWAQRPATDIDSEIYEMQVTKITFLINLYTLYHPYHLKIFP